MTEDYTQNVNLQAFSSNRILLANNSAINSCIFTKIVIKCFVSKLKAKILRLYSPQAW